MPRPVGWYSEEVDFFLLHLAAAARACRTIKSARSLENCVETTFGRRTHWPYIANPRRENRRCECRPHVRGTSAVEGSAEETPRLPKTFGSSFRHTTTPSF